MKFFVHKLGCPKNDVDAEYIAARLIEASGLKGLRRGAVGVSEKHANFIINYGGAKATEIEDLLHHVGQTVATEQGIILQPEVHILGQE